MRTEAFCEAVANGVPRATAAERRDILQELAGHLADHMETLMDAGYDAELAEERAVAAMGDPEEVGRALNAQLSPFWLWVRRLGWALTVCLALVLLGHSGVRGTVENLEIRRGQYRDWLDSYSADDGWHWRPDLEMTVGEDVVRVTGVELQPREDGTYRCGVFLSTYAQNPLRPASEGVIHDLRLLDASGKLLAEGVDMARSTEARLPYWWRGGVYDEWFDCTVTEADDALTVAYDRFGRSVSMRVPLDWEGRP
ncbi:hypothetical protein CE91St43_11480 [Oscillospiraceae bacterium]|nr:hypothetical protein CE91St43_11480 [Oscillospiraceae bacterium]